MTSWGAHCAPRFPLSWATPQCRAEAHDTGSAFVRHTHQQPRLLLRSHVPPRPQRHAAIHSSGQHPSVVQKRVTLGRHMLHTHSSSRRCDRDHAAIRRPRGASCAPHYCLRLHQVPWHCAQARDAMSTAHTHDQRPMATIAPACHDKQGVLAAPPAPCPLPPSQRGVPRCHAEVRDIESAQRTSATASTTPPPQCDCVW
jgi:hypothetical protein